MKYSYYLYSVLSVKSKFHDRSLSGTLYSFYDTNQPKCLLETNLFIIGNNLFLQKASPRFFRPLPRKIERHQLVNYLRKQFYKKKIIGTFLKKNLTSTRSLQFYLASWHTINHRPITKKARNEA